MASDSQDSKTLTFPIQLATEDDLEDCYDIDVLAFQTRLWATKLITAIQNGQVEPTEKVIQNLKSFNATLKAWSRPEVDLSFLE